MSLQRIKTEIAFLSNDVRVLENVLREKRAALKKTIETMQALCSHPNDGISVYRSYGEKTRECTVCGKEW